MFSLQELARMEDERVRSQAEAARLEKDALEFARQEVEARVREDAETQAREESEKRQEAERKEREEVARVEAIHRGALEAARLEVDARARAEERERDRRHELQKLEMARHSANGERLGVRRMVSAGLMGALAAGVVAAGLHLGIVQPGERARATLASSELAARDAVIAEAHGAASKARGQLQSLTDDLAAAKADVARLQKQIDEAPRTTTRPRASAPTVTRTVPSDTQVGLSRCPPGSLDPVCVHL
jgi:hypothetical protein